MVVAIFGIALIRYRRDSQSDDLAASRVVSVTLKWQYTVG